VVGARVTAIRDVTARPRAQQQRGPLGREAARTENETSEGFFGGRRGFEGESGFDSYIETERWRGRGRGAVIPSTADGSLERRG